MKSQNKIIIGFVVSIITVSAVGGYLIFFDSSDNIEYEYPNGASQEGIEANNMTEEHFRNLNSSSYKINLKSQTIINNSSAEFTLKYSYSSDKSYLVTINRDLKTETYTNFTSGRQYEKEESFEETDYQSRSISETEEFVAEDFLSDRLGATNFSLDDIMVTNSGIKIAEYNVTGTKEENISAEGRVLIAEKGYIKEFNVTYTQDDGTRSVQTLEVTDYNSTTLQEPDWVEKARDN